MYYKSVGDSCDSLIDSEVYRNQPVNCQSVYHPLIYIMNLFWRFEENLYELVSVIFSGNQ